MNTRFFPGPHLDAFRAHPSQDCGWFPTPHRNRDQIRPASVARTTSSSGATSGSPHRPGGNSPIPPTSGLGGSGVPLPRWKRALDLTGCLLALPALGVCTLVMTILTKRVSPGPVFFLQERVGYMGRRFKIYKFRTMKMGADCSVHQEYCKQLIHSNAAMVKLDNRGDSRLIPLGWLLRATGLDELPQLINVLRGEMSLVGPRPCIPSEFEQFVSWQRQRCDALPGLTGLWQVSGKNRTTFEQMIRFDVQYSREYSFWLDLKIIFLTTPTLLAQLRETYQLRKAPPKIRPPHAVAQMKPVTLSAKHPSTPPVPTSESTESLLNWLDSLRQRPSAATTTTTASERPPAPPRQPERCSREHRAGSQELDPPKNV